MADSAVALTGRVPQLAKFEILEEIGHGGMATVYRARDKRLGREVAIKVIHAHLRDSSEVVSRFNAEAKAVAKLRHRNIVEVFDVSEPNEPEQYLVAELVRGTTLRKLLQEHGAMPPEVAAVMAIELLGALAHAHASGVVHRDIKPENVLVERTPPPPGERATDRVVVKLTDFGIAKLLDAQGVTSTGQVLGSPAHMAPEQIEGGDVDARADLFALGVLLYECMVGHLPFEGNNPAQVLRRVLDGRYPEAQSERPIVGTRWSHLLDGALAHAPADRFRDAKAMADAIVAELDRLGFVSPARELEAWLAAPEQGGTYDTAHAKRMVDKLCSLAADARKRGDVLSAASDYNRALAHNPNDPQLLRVVAGMNRAEARARVLRRALAAATVMLALGAVAFAVGRYVRAHGWHSGPGVLAAQGPVPLGSAGTAGQPPPRADSDSAEPAGLSRPPVASARTPGRDAVPPRSISRTLTFDLKPPMGVSLSIDSQAMREVTTGGSLTLDGRAHSLAFSCPVCNSVQVAVAAGDKDETLVVSVPVRPAIVVVEGDLAKTYAIAQHPELTIRAGTNTVPLRSAFERVTVTQIETGVSLAVRLEAGKTIHAAFE